MSKEQPREQPHCDGRKVKILMLGDGGRSRHACVNLRFTDNTFEETFISTVGGAHMRVVSYV